MSPGAAGRGVAGPLAAAAALALFLAGIVAVWSGPSGRPAPAIVAAPLEFAGRFTFASRLSALESRLVAEKLRLEKELEGRGGAYGQADCESLLGAAAEVSRALGELRAAGGPDELRSQAAAAEESRAELEAAAARLQAALAGPARSRRAAAQKAESALLRTGVHLRGLSASLSRP